MNRTPYEPFLAFATALSALTAAIMLVQTAGNALDVHLTPYALWLSLPVAAAAGYGLAFRPSARNVAAGVGLAAALACLGYLSALRPDWSWDGIAYQQPAALAILEGWNPLRPAPMLWQNIYPSGVWAVEAAVAAAYGTIEAAKAVQWWWVFIALPVWLQGLREYLGPLGRGRLALAVTAVLNPVVLVQLGTHYVDGMLYLAGVSFLGALLLTDGPHRRAAWLVMGAAVTFMVNAKLSGIYHAVAWCLLALVFLRLRQGRMPWQAGWRLLAVGLVATFVIGWRPYATNFLTYGALMPLDRNAFAAAQRPVNLAQVPAPGRFVYSVFSQTAGEGPREPARLKWPWEVAPSEWHVAGYPDARSGGFGPLYALGLVLSAAVVLGALYRRSGFDGPLALLAAGCLAASAAFPEGWWLRYVPFAYTAPLLALLAIRRREGAVRWGCGAAAVVFALNAALTAGAAWRYAGYAERRFAETLAAVRRDPSAPVYLVPPGADYEVYNHAHRTLQRRLSAEGIDAPVRVGAPCGRMAGIWADFRVCY